MVPEVKPSAPGEGVEGLTAAMNAPMKTLNESLFFLRDNVTQGLGQMAQSIRTTTAPFIDFEQRLANVNSLLGEGENAASLYQEGLLSMVGTTRRNAADLTDGLYQVVSAFGSNGDTLGILETNARAATAGLATTEQAIALTSAATKAYGNATAEGVQKVADLAQKTVQLGQTTFPELAGSIGAVTPLAAELKVSQEELFAVFATMTGVTGGASEVATQYRGALQALLDPSEAMTALLKQQGFESGKAAIEAKGFVGVMQLVAQAAEQSGKPLTDYIGSIEGVSLVLPLAGAQATRAADSLAAMQDAAGASAEAFERNTATLGSSLANLKNRMEAVRIQAVATGKGFMTGAVDGVAAMVDWVSKLPPGLQATALALTNVITLGGQFTVSVVAPMVTAFPGIIQGIRGVVTATRAWIATNVTLNATAGVIGVIALVVGAFVASASDAQAAAKNTGGAFEEMGQDAEWAGQRVADLAANLDAITSRQLQSRIASAHTALELVNNSITSIEQRLSSFQTASPADLLTMPRDLYNPSEANPESHQNARTIQQMDEREMQNLQQQLNDLRQERLRLQGDLTSLQEEARRRRAETSTPTTLTNASNTTSTQDEATRRAALQAQLDDARAKSTDIAHDREIAAIADEGERRRREIAETERQQKDAADRTMLATLARLEAEGVTGERLVQERAVAVQVNINARSEAEAAREKALAALARDEAERTARHEASLLEVRQQNERTTLERRHGDELAAITDEGDRRTIQIRQTYEVAEQAAQQKRDADIARIDATTATETEKERQRTVVRQQYEATISKAELDRVSATREAQAAADREHVEQLKARLEEQVQQIQARLGGMADVLSGSVSAALEGQRRQSRAEIDLQRMQYDEQEENLKKSLRRREIEQSEYELRMQALGEQRRAFETKNDADRADVALRITRTLVGALLAEGQRWLVQRIVQYTAEALAHAGSEKAKTLATATGTAARTGFNLGEIGSSLLNAGATMVGAVASGIRAVAGLPFPLNVALGAAAVAGLTALYAGAKDLMGFAVGGYTGDGERQAPAGIVHRGEFVFTKAQVGGDPGPFYALASALNRGWTMERVLALGGLQGYATGGYVSPSSFASSETKVVMGGYDDTALRVATERNTAQMAGLRKDVQALAKRPITYVVGDADARRQRYAAEREDRRVDPRRRL